MFTGIIQSKGTLVKHRKGQLTVQYAEIPTHPGDSIAVNGACLTAVKIHKKPQKRAQVLFEISKETYAKTTLLDLKKGAHVNIEPAVSLKQTLGGHIVQGHVDGVGSVSKIIPSKSGVTMWFKCPPKLMKGIVPKGSVTVDGVSLTAAKVKKNEFSVALIPFTLNHTNLGSMKVGTKVNLETDIIGKYVLKYLKK